MGQRKRLAALAVVLMVILASCVGLGLTPIGDDDFQRDKDWPDATPGDTNDPR